MNEEARELWAQLRAVYGDEAIWRPMARLNAVVLSLDGKSPKEIADAVKKSVSEVRSWLRDYGERGIQGLFPLDEDRILTKRSLQLFSNLLVARLAEDLFGSLLGDELPKIGLKAVDRRAQYSETDFGIVESESGRDVMLVNVKVHSSLFEQAQQFVGLGPTDTFPLALYKILMGFKQQKQLGIPFLFLVSVKWGIVDEVIKLVDQEDEKIIHLIFRTRTPGKRRAEDKLVDSLIAKMHQTSRWSKLLAVLEKDGDHRVISAEKALSVFMDKFETRCPGLSLRAFSSKFAGRRGLPAEINMHFSISREMTSIAEFLAALRQHGPQGISASGI